MSKITNIEIDSSIQSLVDARNVLNDEQKHQWSRMVAGYLTESEITELLSSILRLAKEGGITPDYHALMRVIEEVEGGELHYYTFASSRLKGWNGFELVDEVELSQPERVSWLAQLQSKFNVLLSKYKLRSLRLTGFRFNGIRTLYVSGLSAVASLFLFGLASAYGASGYSQAYNYAVEKTDSGVSRVINAITGVESAKAEKVDENISPSPLVTETVASSTSDSSSSVSSDVATEGAVAIESVSASESASSYVTPVVDTYYEPAPVASNVVPAPVASTGVSSAPVAPAPVPPAPVVSTPTTTSSSTPVVETPATEVGTSEVVTEAPATVVEETPVEVAPETPASSEVVTSPETPTEVPTSTGSSDTEVSAPAGE